VWAVAAVISGAVVETEDTGRLVPEHIGFKSDNLGGDVTTCSLRAKDRARLGIESIQGLCYHEALIEGFKRSEVASGTKIFLGLRELGTNRSILKLVRLCAGRKCSHSKISNRVSSLSKYTYRRAVQRCNPLMSATTC
jgi:hypothetical protein